VVGLEVPGAVLAVGLAVHENLDFRIVVASGSFRGSAT